MKKCRPEIFHFCRSVAFPLVLKSRKLAGVLVEGDLFLMLQPHAQSGYQNESMSSSLLYLLVQREMNQLK